MNTALVIDSGATNSNWKFLNNDDSHELLKFKGFNLATNNLDVFQFDFPEVYAELVTTILFFGAGTGDPGRERILREKLQAMFPLTKKVVIGSDLLTAGLALSDGERCVISILGTGSNCCVFNGNAIELSINNLGFILGDEGSGFLMGRTVLQDYFYHKMSREDSDLFTIKYNLSRDELVRNTYLSELRPNTYIASFCTFLAHCSAGYRHQVSTTILEQFFDKQLEQFRSDKQVHHHFSGSISWHFQEVIKELCLKYDYKLGKIIQNPLDSLSYSKILDFI